VAILIARKKRRATKGTGLNGTIAPLWGHILTALENSNKDKICLKRGQLSTIWTCP